MIQTYLTELQSRLKVLSELIGDKLAYEQESKACKQKFQQILAKFSTNKQFQRKYQRLTTFLDKHNATIDLMYTSDKVNIIVDQLDSLAQSAQILNRIQKNLPSLQTPDYKNNCISYTNFDTLLTGSQLKLKQGLGTIEVIKYDQISLQKIRDQQRLQMNSIMQLNYRMINNLNQKLKLAYANKMKK